MAVHVSNAHVIALTMVIGSSTIITMFKAARIVAIWGVMTDDMVIVPTLIGRPQLKLLG